MARRSVFTRGSSPRLFQPTPRDLRAVEDVERFRFLTSAQLLELNWPRPSQRRHGESRLRELFHAGWLERHPFIDGLGRPRAVYSLGPLGRLYVADKLGVSASRLGPRPAKERDHDLIFLKHHLMTVQTVINLKLASERLGGSLVHHESERVLRAKRGAPRAAMPVVPDAFVVLVVGPRVQSFCIELDRATVDLRSWRQRLHRYWQWERTASFREDLKAPAVLIVVEARPRIGQRRVLDIKKLIDEEAKSRGTDPGLFWCTTLDEAGPDKALIHPVWLVGGQEGLHPLLRGD